MEAILFLIKALCNLSLVMIIVNLVFGIIAYVPAWHPLVLLGATLLSGFVYMIKKSGQRKLIFVVVILAAAPLAFLPPDSIVFILLNYIFAIYVGINGIDLKRDYGLMAGIFGKGFALVCLLALVLLVLGASSPARQNFTLYIFVFLVSAVYLLRTLRHLTYNSTEQELRKINLSYGLFTITTAVIFASPAVRQFIGEILSRIYDFSIGIILFLVSWLVLPFAYLAQWLSNRLSSAQWQGRHPIIPITGSPNNSLVQRVTEANGNLWQHLFSILQIPAEGLAMCLLVYGLLRFLRRFNDESQGKSEYREYRESTFSLRGSIPGLTKVVGLFTPKNNAEALRYYYRRFLGLCLQRKIAIGPSDTTLEINKKAEQHFAPETLAAMRMLYLGVRYGDQPCREETVHKFRSLLRRLG